MVINLAARQTPRLSRIFAFQQHQPLLSPSHSDSRSSSPSPSLSPEFLEHTDNTDFLLDSPPKSQVDLQSPFFFDVRDAIESDQRLDPASDSVRTGDDHERSYDFSLVVPEVKKDKHFALLIHSNMKVPGGVLGGRSAANMSPSKPDITAAAPLAAKAIKAKKEIPLLRACTKDVKKERDARQTVETQAEETVKNEDSVHVPAATASSAIAANLSASSPLPQPKPIRQRPSLTIDTSPDDCTDDDSGSQPLAHCKRASSRSCAPEDAATSSQKRVTEDFYANEVTSPKDFSLSLETGKEESQPGTDKENNDDDTQCLLADKGVSKSSSDDNSHEAGGDSTKDLEASPSTLSRLRLPKLKAAKQSMPNDRYDAMISKLGKERQRVDLMHAKLRHRRASSTDIEEIPAVISRNSLAAKTREKILKKDPVLVFEPPQARVDEVVASNSNSLSAKGYQELMSPSKVSIPSSVPEWAKAGYLQRSRQKRLNRLRKAGSSTPTNTPGDISINCVQQPVVSMMPSYEG